MTSPAVSDGEGPAFAFFVTADVGDEVCAGFDARALAATLHKRGFLGTTERGEHLTTKSPVPGHGHPRWCDVAAAILDEAVMESAILRDLDATVARETDNPPAEPAPAPSIRPDKDG